MSKDNKNVRRLLTASMGLAFIISLSSCSGATNTKGNLPNKDYATAGKYTVSYEELWDELKWSASDLIEEKKSDVVISKYTKKVASVMSQTYDDTAKEYFETEDDFKKAYEEYATRLVDYVTVDIYNLAFSNADQWDTIEDFEKSTFDINEVRYADDTYQKFKIEKINNKNVYDLIVEARQKHTAYNPETDNYLECHSIYVDIAKAIPDEYYPQLAKELLTYDYILDAVIEKDGENKENINISDDEYGYYSQSSYVNKFKDLYAHNYDVNAVVVKFASEDEYNDTLRAFGLKYYNKELYYITDKTDGMSYTEYCDYYDDLGNKEMTSGMINISATQNNAILEIFVQIYNYVYGDYATETGTKHLDTAFNFDKSEYTVENLRKLTYKILQAYSANQEEDFKTECELLKNQNSDLVTYDRDLADDISTSFTNYLYDTLDLDGTPYSTTSQNYNSGYYIMYKFSQGEKSDAEKKFENANDGLKLKDATTDEIANYIFTCEEKDSLFDTLRDELIKADITDSKISTAVSEKSEDIKVQIYNEYVQVGYSVKHEEYSKTIGSPKDKNLLATLTYEGQKFDFNIFATENVEDGDFYNIGSNTSYGVFNDLETENGATTAIDLLSKKMVKDTKPYADTKKDKKTYEEYLDTILYNFAYDSYSSSGYPASIGKYNFLMLYFHDTDIDRIIDNYYRVQTASASLLTDYTSDDLVSFFETYTSSLYENYFSVSGTRLVVYYDLDDDGNPDKLKFDEFGNIVNDGTNWSERTVKFEGSDTTLEVVAKKLIYKMYNKILASNKDHTTRLSELIEEYNGSARVVYANNPIAAEKEWAAFKKLGLQVKTEDFDITNSITDTDFALKQRLYEYTITGDGAKYDLFLNDTVPSSYIENISEANLVAGDNTIIATNDGYNLIVVTSASTKESAKFEKEDSNSGLYENLYLYYNDNYLETPISDVYNDGDKLNSNQIKLYVIDYMQNGSSTLSPSAYSTAIESFLSPVITRYTSDATQREILLAFIDYIAYGENSGKKAYEIVVYDEALGYNGEGGYMDKAIQINRASADNYSEYLNDYTGTSQNYTNWWTDLDTNVKKFIIKNTTKDGE